MGILDYWELWEASNIAEAWSRRKSSTWAEFENLRAKSALSMFFYCLYWSKKPPTSLPFNRKFGKVASDFPYMQCNLLCTISFAVPLSVDCRLDLVCFCLFIVVGLVFLCVFFCLGGFLFVCFAVRMLMFPFGQFWR